MESLTNLMRPPAKPSELPDRAGWDAIEANLGFELPEDYKAFVSKYGTGIVDEFLWVLNPFSENPALNLVERASILLEAQREFAEETGIENPYALHPEPDGLFPWGVTDNGDNGYAEVSHQTGPSCCAIAVCPDGESTAFRPPSSWRP